MSGVDRLRNQANKAATRRAAAREPVFEHHPDQTSLLDDAPASPAPAPAPPAAPAPAPAAPARRAAAPRTKPVRITVDLQPLPYRALNRWCREAAEHLELPRVTAASVVRSLLAQLDDDPALAEAVRARIAMDSGSQ